MVSTPCYRLNSIIMQQDISDKLQMFKDSFAKGRLGHAYLVVGDPRGNAGELAERILMMLFCRAGANSPCGKCADCLRVAKRVHPDIAWIEPVKKSRGILVEQIKAVIQSVFQTSFEGGWKAIVLAGAERLNIEAANKLLKTLEEPPPRSIFLLLSDQPEALPATIISRCQRVALSDWAAGPESELRPALAEIAAGLGRGGVAARLRLARKMVELLKRLREAAEAEGDAWLEKSQVSGEQAEDLEEVGEGRVEAVYRERRRKILRLFLLWQRDLFVSACGLGSDEALFFREHAAEIRSAARGLTYQQAIANINVAENIQACLEQHLPEPIVLERAFLQLQAGGREKDVSSSAR